MTVVSGQVRPGPVSRRDADGMPLNCALCCERGVIHFTDWAKHQPASYEPLPRQDGNPSVPDRPSVVL